MKIAIIGCGYVGKAMASFWQSGHDLTVTTTRVTKISELETIANRVICCQGNELDSLKEITSDRDLILLTVGAPNRNAYAETYLETAKTLVLALRENPIVKQIIYTSSYAVLGNKQGEWVTENTPVAPSNENTQILLETEQVLSSLEKQNKKLCILRLGGIYGANREIIKIFQSWAGTTRPGNAQEYSNWIHLDDIVGAIELVKEKQLQGIYHLANDVPLKKSELLAAMCQRHNLSPIIWDTSVEFIPPYNVRLSNQKIKEAGLKLIYPETLL